MKKNDLALSTLAKIREAIENETIGFDNPEAEKRIEGLIKILKMQTSGFLADDLQQNSLREQIGNLAECNQDLFRGERPRFFQSHTRCQEEMIQNCIVAQGLIERHAKNEESKASWCEQFKTKDNLDLPDLQKGTQSAQARYTYSSRT